MESPILKPLSVPELLDKGVSDLQAACVAASFNCGNN